MNKWIETKGLFLDDSELSELTGKKDTEWEDYSFRLNRVESYNRAANSNGTCLRMESGFDINVVIPYDDFKQLIKNNTE